MNEQRPQFWSGSNGSNRGPVAYGSEAIAVPHGQFHRAHPVPARRPQRYAWRIPDTAARPMATGAPSKRRGRFLPAVILSLGFHAGLLAVMALKTWFVPVYHPPQFAMATEPFLVHIAPWAGAGTGGGDGGPAGDGCAPGGERKSAGPPLVGMAGTMPRPHSPVPNVIGVGEEISRETRRLQDSTDWVLPVGPVLAEALADGPSGSPGATNGSVYGSIDGQGSGRGPGGTGWGGSGNGSGYGKPSYLRNPPPPYPRVARENGWEGTTVLQVEVLDNGTGGKIEVVKSSGYPVLDESAVETVQRWRFLPAKSGETPIRSLVEIPISFRMVNN